MVHPVGRGLATEWRVYDCIGFATKANDFDKNVVNRNTEAKAWKKQ